MSKSLSASAQRVQLFLQENGFAMEVKELPDSTRTAKEAADAIGCSVPQIAKSLVFKDADLDKPVLIVASGSNRVDTKKIEQATGIRLSKADGDFVKKRVGYAIGGVPPVGHTEKVTTFLDPDLKEFETIWAAAGTPFAVFSLKPDDLERLTGGTFLDLAE
ncbi:YbaK/EbsC family protein [Hahella sp. HN01]|uniref:YbaK/EbsC family protein n=1 Tax=Hahella sp. HN01 TaxID=2847262 RepID=UPI001C1EF4C8|nr:YbaK/EbsC family protein [Hahella sp. HN01]MBU6955626.1 YbaK/EbsC family protein [Hahella sp. HN01]